MAKKYYNTKTRKDTSIYPKKKASEKRQGGHIDNWQVVDYRGDGNYKVVFGHVKGDSIWDNSPSLRTSLIVSIDREKKVLETLNTIYTLGEEITD